MFSPRTFDLNNQDRNDETTENLSNETEIKIACHTVMIGSYHFKPRTKVRISSEGFSILAPKVSGQAEVRLHIPLKCFVHVLARTEHTPVVLLYTEAKTGERVRSALGMREEGGPYFDPLSPLDALKRVALVPAAALARRPAAALRTLFGMVLDDLDAGDARVRDVRAGLTHAPHAPRATHATHADPPPSAHSDSERPDSAPRAAERPSRASESTQDNESSSSSVIFPPSPAPISLSSPSTVHSPKSSPTRKRKIRHKKGKNKKMKYVLVKNPEPHDVDAFLAGLAPILKGLSPLLLNLAKTEIISAALKYEMRMLTENCNGVSK